MGSTNTMTIWAGYHETAVGKTIGFRLSHLGLTFQSGQFWFGKSVGEAPLFCRVLKTGHAHNEEWDFNPWDTGSMVVPILEKFRRWWKWWNSVDAKSTATMGWKQPEIVYVIYPQLQWSADILCEDQWRVSGGDTYLNHPQSLSTIPGGGFAIETSHDQYSKWIQVDMGWSCWWNPKFLLANESWLLPLW